MRRSYNPWLVLLLLITVCFTLATWLSPRFNARQQGRSDSFMALLLGDSRRLFANHLFVKADEYFHSGFYPSIFDNQESFQTPHMAADAGALKEKNSGEETEFMGKPRDFIEEFSRNFIPSRHTHLDEGGAEGKAGDLGEAANGDVREILPWLQMSAEMDPSRVETYMVTAYWLRRKMGKVDEAEEFLRQGLRANPGNASLLFELGRIYKEDRKDPNHARNVWELGVHRLDSKSSHSEQDDFIMSQLTLYLARLEEEQGNLKQSLAWLERLKQYSAQPQTVQKQIEEMRQKVAHPETATNASRTIPSAETN